MIYCTSNHIDEISIVVKTLYSADTSSKPSNAVLVMQELAGFVPHALIPSLLKIPHRTTRKMRHHRAVNAKVGNQLIDRQLEFLAAGQEGGKDLMSLLGSLDPDV